MNTKKKIAAVCALLLIASFASCNKGAQKEDLSDFSETYAEITSEYSSSEETSSEPEAPEEVTDLSSESAAGVSVNETSSSAEAVSEKPSKTPQSKADTAPGTTAAPETRTSAASSSALTTKESASKSTRPTRVPATTRATTAAPSQTQRNTTQQVTSSSAPAATTAPERTTSATTKQSGRDDTKPVSSKPADTTKPSTPSSKPASNTVKVVIDCTNAVKYGASGLPANGVMAVVEVEYRDGDTARSVLDRAAEKSGLEVKGRKDYVKGIGGLSEFDCGSNSGWLYKVNGTFPNKGADSFKVNAGDEVVWVYTVKPGDTGYTG